MTEEQEDNKAQKENDIKDLENDVTAEESNTDKNKEPEMTTPEKSKGSTLDQLLTGLQDESKGLQQGLKNLADLPEFSQFEDAMESNNSSTLKELQVNGKPFERGIIGFKRSSQGELRVAIACGKSQVRYITLPKFIALIENMHDRESSTIIIQNFKDQDSYQSARGQILARINAKSSAITVIQGVTGRIIRGPGDIAILDVYYLNRTDLTAYYLSAKAQISNQNELETMIQAYDGWKHFDVPLDPLNPYDY